MELEEIKDYVKNATRKIDEQYWLGRLHSMQDVNQKLEAKDKLLQSKEQKIERLESIALEKYGIRKDLEHENTQLKKRVEALEGIVKESMEYAIYHGDYGTLNDWKERLS